MCAGHSTYAKVRRHLYKLGSLLPPSHRFQGLNSGCTRFAGQVLYPLNQQLAPSPNDFNIAFELYDYG